MAPLAPRPRWRRIDPETAASPIPAAGRGCVDRCCCPYRVSLLPASVIARHAMARRMEILRATDAKLCTRKHGVAVGKHLLRKRSAESHNRGWPVQIKSSDFRVPEGTRVDLKKWPTHIAPVYQS